MPQIAKTSLPKGLSEGAVKPALLSQAVRVYLANQRQGTQSALTRAEVSRTRKKYQKQKGSGNARHGDRKAPIFVGGGIAFAPKPRDHSLSLSKTMRRQAILGALSMKAADKDVFIATDLTKLTGKTAEAAGFLLTLNLPGKSFLVIVDQPRENIHRAMRNLSGVNILPASQVNIYEILKADRILIMEEALENLQNPQAPEKELPQKTRPEKKTTSSKATPAKAKTTAKAKNVTKAKRPNAVKKTTK